MIIKKIKEFGYMVYLVLRKKLASKFFKKKLKNSFIFDGDKIRKYISFELGYSIKDRKIQLKRMFGLIKI